MSDDDPSDGESPSRNDDDPFERLGADADREGDPFERLAEETPTEEQDQVPERDPWVPPGQGRNDETADDSQEDTSPTDAPSDGPTSPDSTAPDSPVDDVHPTKTGQMDVPDHSVDVQPGDDSDDPFADVETPAESPFGESGSVFERVESGRANPDDVWEAITAKDDRDEPASVPDDGRYSEVSKHTYCEQCEYFSSPPDVTCTHETAEIIEFLDMETVRLLNCPVVAEREALERGE